MNNEVDWDFLYEADRDDKAIEMIEQESLFGEEQCNYCGNLFDVDDLDRYGGEWICNKCEKELK